MARSRDQPQTGKDFPFSIDLYVTGADRVDPLENAAVLTVGDFPFAALHVDGDTRERGVLAAVVEVQVPRISCAFGGGPPVILPANE